ncbi:34639_t:CDS:2, partial [Racocetra persica]
YNVALVFEIIRGVRESPKNGTPQEFINLYQKCWDHNPDVRPHCSEILEELKKIIQQKKGYKYEDHEIEKTTKSHNSTTKFELHFNFNDCELDIGYIEKQARLQTEFINNFGLNKGRTLDGSNNIAFGTKTLLGDHGDLSVSKLNQEPTIIIPREEGNIAVEVSPEYDTIRLHFPTAS